MSFRIGILENGELETVYGFYPTKINILCEILKNNYSKQIDVKNLIALGDIYSLNDNINDTKYYERDKGDPKNACVSYKEKVNSLDLINTDASPVDYYIIWTNKWNIFSKETSEWITLNKFLNNFKKKK